MNETKLLKQLEAATTKRVANGREPSSELSDPNGLRDAWLQLSSELSQRDEQENADQSEFFGRMLSALDGENTPDHDEQLRVRAAAIVACNRTQEEATSWKSWLALVAVVAICGSAVFWFDFEKKPVRVTKIDAAKPLDQMPPKLPAAGQDTSSDIAENANSAVTELPWWTDPVDDEIARANEQLLAMQSRTAWDRSVQAFEHYRQSVEQEMNHWDL